MSTGSPTEPPNVAGGEAGEAVERLAGGFGGAGRLAGRKGDGESVSEVGNEAALLVY